MVWADQTSRARAPVARAGRRPAGRAGAGLACGRWRGRSGPGGSARRLHRERFAVPRGAALWDMGQRYGSERNGMRRYLIQAVVKGLADSEEKRGLRLGYSELMQGSHRMTIEDLKVAGATHRDNPNGLLFGIVIDRRDRLRDSKCEAVGKKVILVPGQLAPAACPEVPDLGPRPAPSSHAPEATDRSSP